MKFKLILTLVFAFCYLLSNAQRENKIIVSSPGKKVVIQINIEDNKLSYSVKKHNQQALLKSSLGLVVDGNDLGQNVSITDKPKEKTVTEKYALLGNHSQAINNYKEISIPLKSTNFFYQLQVRAYDDGIAIRYVINSKKIMHIEKDNTAFGLPVTAQCYWAFYSDDNENLHNNTSLSDLPENKALLAPLTIKTDNFYLSFTEADCQKFPDLSWTKAGNQLKANFTTNPNGWNTEAGTVISPWRLAIIADNLTQLVNSDMIMNLCPAPNPSNDFSWVKPGRVMWQWWSVGEPKFNDQKNWYDAAARLTWEYYLIDDGWRTWRQPGKDQWQCLKEVIDYGKTKGVKSIIWVDSKEMRTREGIKTYLEKVKQAGAVGIKIDFIPPATPEIMQWYEAAREETYKLHLMVDFHGCTKPTGVRRTWPHELTREGVRGNEYQMTRYNRVAPKNQDELKPFTRFIAGPADLTPVIFTEKELNGFTWTHQLAQAVVYLSPLTHFADAYNAYINNPAEELLKDIPTVWDETIVLPCSEVGKVAAFAKRKDHEWWIGIMNGEETSNISFNLDFLKSKAQATILTDKKEVLNAFDRKETIVNKTDNINIELRPGGGYFMRLKMAH
ncbi:MAG: glycoside hydrolase family 97 catalytic domain-containing protein [Bacteroidetes bacterium]|nr:glycoside hydrolase family 97 catalytic domain-containing protein [Bacteroidota bacterium]